LKRYQEADAIDDEYAQLEFRIARVAMKLGDYKAAKDHFIRARDLDTLRFRADSRINEINRSVAASVGAALVDAEKILSDAAPDGIIGTDQIYEHVHMTPEAITCWNARYLPRLRPSCLKRLKRPSLCPKQTASDHWRSPALIGGGWRTRCSGGCRRRHSRTN
jgi:hypothetical protein